ncbi:DUF1553 domain-containing protein [Candidatus Laterigemmans baculatus]|uniref:DUF1553 domain-containing protein n=1 Tax=Candidatus Laterigemmans baculatus TaxID=2770505 RepID=UPI0013DCBC9B|nr:DUF1553 domain-containing protein [Candidatus Laterigemmans baculatus]
MRTPLAGTLLCAALGLGLVGWPLSHDTGGGGRVSYGGEVPELPSGGAAAEHLKLFTDGVLPIFREHCFDCHAGEDFKGGLALDTRAGLVTGGDSGSAIDETDPEYSLLLSAVRYEGLEMPPSGKLDQASIDTIARWVAAGAPYLPEMQGEPGAQRAEPPGARISESDRQFWAFQPLADPAVPELSVGAAQGDAAQGDAAQWNPAEWAENPIDAFIAARLQAAGLEPNGPAAPADLIRRLHYDLTGLPPSSDLVAAFVADPSERHYQRIVDTLLASPEYGERWGRHWLDLVRYAETNSYERDAAKPEVWRYRDYVIDAFNSDKPFDAFTVEQLAGDELPFAAERLIATGYHRLGIWDDEPADPELALYDDLDDLVMTTGQVFLGLTINCARCHDHKIDPIRQADYYRFLSFFSGLNRYGIRGADTVKQFSLRPLVPPREAEEHRAAVEDYQQAKKDAETTLEAIHDKVKGDFAPVEHEEFRHPMNRLTLVEQRVGRQITAEEFASYRETTERLRELERDKPASLAMALCVTEIGSEPRETFLLTRGNPHAPAAPVEPGIPEVLSPPSAAGGYNPPIPPSPNPGTSGRRSVLARWIVDPEQNPLTPRVTANRLWQYHFGRGLVRTPNDFGFQGTPPTHPALLDWLSSRLVEAEWHLKPLHRLLVSSQTYRMSSRANSKALAADPTNDHYWRFDPRRLSAEEIRDSMLAVSGRLNLAKGGPSMYPTIEPEVLAGQSRPGDGWHDSPLSERSRRAVYIHIKRSLAVPLLASFDMADTDFTCPVRFATTQPTQALGMLNSDFTSEQARVLAADAVRAVGEAPEDFAAEVLRRVSQREPSSAELAEAVGLLERLSTTRGETPERARELLALVALNLNEFVYLD